MNYNNSNREEPSYFRDFVQSVEDGGYALDEVRDYEVQMRGPYSNRDVPKPKEVYEIAKFCQDAIYRCASEEKTNNFSGMELSIPDGIANSPVLFKYRRFVEDIINDTLSIKLCPHGMFFFDGKFLLFGEYRSK